MGAKRIIEPAMVAYLDRKLKSNGLAQEAIRVGLPRIHMVQSASACVGIREATGNNDGPMVELIQETVGGADQEAWCMSFVQTILAYTELKFSLQSKIFVSEGCDQVWMETPKTSRVERIPLPGAIVIWGHYDSKGRYTGGHTGILLSCGKSIFHAIEGNTTGGTDPNGAVIREGGGVYLTQRLREGNGSMKVRGFLKPFEAVK